MTNLALQVSALSHRLTLTRHVFPTLQTRLSLRRRTKFSLKFSDISISELERPRLQLQIVRQHLRILSPQSIIWHQPDHSFFVAQRLNL